MKIDVTEFINALADAIVERMTEKVAPETPAPKKRGRPKKTEAEEKPARRRGRPPKEAKKEESKEEEITPEHVQGLLQQYSGVFGRQNVVDLLKAHGAKSLPDLDEKEYAAICAAAQKELDKANTDIDLGI